MHTNIVLDTGVFASDGLNPSNFRDALRRALGGDSSATYTDTLNNFINGYSYRAYLIDTHDSTIKVKITPIFMIVQAEDTNNHSFNFSYDALNTNTITYTDGSDWATGWSGSEPNYRIVVTISRNQF